MDESWGGFADDVKLPVLLVMWILVVLATVVLVISETVPVTVGRLNLYIFCILVFLGGAVVWGLDRWDRSIARFLAIVMLLGVVYGGAYGLRLPAMLSFTGAATVAAAALMGIPAAAGAAVIEIVLVVALGGAVPDLVGGQPELSVVSLALRATGILVTLGSIQAIYRRMRSVAEWSWDHYTAAQLALDEVRSRKAELEQTLEALVYANRQLALANERVAALRAAAEDAQKAKTTFVARVSHEFRTPLNMIIGLVSLMIESPEIYAVDVPPDMLKDLQIVNRNCDHLAKMVNDVLNLTQIESGRLVLHRERFDLREVIVSAVEAVEPLLAKKGLTMTEVIPDDLPEVYCDRTRIQQVVLNLVSNAARFTEVGGITIRATSGEHDVTIEVQDTGTGILLEDRERIFDPFIQGSTESWRETGGSGLGLAISKQFIEAHGGRIWLQSERGVGTTFFFSLSLSDPVGPLTPPGRWIREDWPWRERQVRPSFGADHYRPRVIVQDATGELQEEFTRRGTDVDVVGTSCLAETEAAIAACPVHAVIVNSPRAEEAFPLVEELRKRVPTTPVFGCMVAPAIARLTASGATGYLVKPVSRTDLTGAVYAAGRPVRRVLLVDDDPDVLRLYARTLQSADPTLQIATASSGPAALSELWDGAAADGDRPDVVLLDVFMPDMGGWEVLAALRGDRRTVDLPVYLVSAHDPAEQLPGSRVFLGAMGDEISIPKLLQCSLTLSKIMLSPDGVPDPGPRQAL